MWEESESRGLPESPVVPKIEDWVSSADESGSHSGLPRSPSPPTSPGSTTRRDKSPGVTIEDSALEGADSSCCSATTAGRGDTFSSRPFILSGYTVENLRHNPLRVLRDF